MHSDEHRQTQQLCKPLSSRRVVRFKRGHSVWPGAEDRCKMSTGDCRACLISLFVDVDECSTTADNRTAGHGCQYACRNTPGSFVCLCPAGWELQPDQRTCRGLSQRAFSHNFLHLRAVCQSRWWHAWFSSWNPRGHCHLKSWTLSRS